MGALGHLGPDCGALWAHIDFKTRFYAISKWLWGAAGSLFGDYLWFLEACIFNAISNMFPDWVFTVLRRFSSLSGILFVTFRWSLALAKTGLPCLRELCFECFEASETDIFLASLFKAL